MAIQTSQHLTSHTVDRSLVRWLMRIVGNPRISIRLWNGDEFHLGDESPVACLEFRSRRAIVELLQSPSVGFGDCYSRGLIEVHGDLLAFMNEITRAGERHGEGRYFWPRFRSRLYSIHANSLSRAWHNVHHHYDLGNDFYALWLDKRMVYTCAYFDSPDATLDQAQYAKLDHVCRKLRLRPGQHVIEAGCGWGALALHMARHYGVNVTAFNTSEEQIIYARELALTEGLSDRVDFVQDDYRNIDRPCDAFASVGMLEHVGRANFRTLGEVIAKNLKPDGLGLIHSIGRSYPGRMDPWITKRIFPGGHAPSLSEIMTVFEPQKFSVLDVENLRPHYARTCAAWLKNFDKVRDKVTSTYGETFTRAWRLYLAGSSAGFQSGSLQLFQVLFAPSANRQVPWTRQYQYAGRLTGE